MGVSGHAVRPRELQQDGSPFTEGGGMDGGVKGWTLTTAVFKLCVLCVCPTDYNVYNNDDDNKR